MSTYSRIEWTEQAQSPSDADAMALGAFLGFLARDLATHAKRVSGLSAGLRNRIRSVVGKVGVDLNAALPDEE